MALISIRLSMLLANVCQEDIPREVTLSVSQSAYHMQIAFVTFN